MSSLLKALKQQQSPLLNDSSPLEPRLMDRGRPKSGVATLMIILLALLCLIALGLVVRKLISVPTAEPVSEASYSADSAGYQWGQDENIENISWPGSEQPVAADNRVPETVNRENETTEPAGREPLDMSAVSTELLAKFEQAVKQSDPATKTAQSLSVVPPLNELDSAFLQQIPEFSYDSHMYVSEPGERWIEFNRQRLFIGDNFSDLVVERIEPQQVILSLKGKVFSVEALQDWGG
ncbi:general secretion pathway protein GspB [Idiomarina seosinensis]|uniref:general secretion pathway protein GspB n=1 Tax=Idiomarina seosinensis TaxID=281739 RepID=UPI00384FEB7B